MLKLFSAFVFLKAGAHWMINAPVAFLWKPKREERNSVKTHCQVCSTAVTGKNWEQKINADGVRPSRIKEYLDHHLKVPASKMTKVVLGARHALEPIARLLL